MLPSLLSICSPKLLLELKCYPGKETLTPKFPVKPWNEATVITWDSKSQTETRFTVNLSYSSSQSGERIIRSAEMLIPPSEQHVVITLSQFQNGAPCTESYTSTRYTLAGTVVSRHTTSRKRWVTLPITFTYRNLRPCDALGTYTIFTYTYLTSPCSRTSRRAHGHNLVSVTVQVTYSALTDEISITTYPSSKISFSSTLTSPHIPTDLFFYKSVAYGYLRPSDRSIPSLSGTVNTLHIFNLSTGTSHPAPMDLLSTEGDPEPMGPQTSSRMNNQNHRILGDERFVVAVCKGGFKAWCFDKNLRMEGEDMEYRNRREGAWRWRLWSLQQQRGRARE